MGGEAGGALRWRVPAKRHRHALPAVPLRRGHPSVRAAVFSTELLTGAILAPGKRTVTSLLRIMGLAHERRFVNDHRVLNRAG